MCHDPEQETQFYHLIRQTYDGTYTNAINGFLKRLDMLIDEYEPSHLAITFDISRTETFRAKKYPEYKAQRRQSPVPLQRQKELIQKILYDMNIPIYSHKMYEGDDIIGSLAKHFSSEIKVLIYANDRDMTQLVGGNTRMWYTCPSYDKAKAMYDGYNQGRSSITYEELPIPSGVFVFSPPTVKWALGVLPEQIPDWKGLAGDSSDNIPGVKGISEQTAAKILKYFPTIENLYDAIQQPNIEEKWREYGLRKASLTALRAEGARDKAFLSKYLATIITDIPILIPLQNLKTDINFEKEDKWKDELNLEIEKNLECFLD